MEFLGHRGRIIEVDADVLKMLSTLVGDGTGTAWKTTPMVGVYARELVSALERMASVPQTLLDYNKDITYSSMWEKPTLSLPNSVPTCYSYTVASAKG